MKERPAHYQHSLGKDETGHEQYAEFYSIVPGMDKKKLKEIVYSHRGDSRPGLEELRKDTSVIARFDSFDEVRVKPLKEKYQVPAALMAYRNAGRIIWDKTMFNGPTAIVGDANPPINICEGGYYDFKATKLWSEPGEPTGPADLLETILQSKPIDLFINTFGAADTIEKFMARYNPELKDRFTAKSVGEFLSTKRFSPDIIQKFKTNNIGQLFEKDYDALSRAFGIETKEIQGLMKAGYSTGKTVEELMPELGITNEDRARYIALGFSMGSDNRKEIGLVKKAKGMGIASDCIATTGGTPPFKKEFFNEGFNFGKFYKDEVTKEMSEEFDLKENEFKITHIHLGDNSRTLPYFSTNIITNYSTEELATKNYGREEAIGEHPILISIKPETLPLFLSKFNMLPDAALIADLGNK
ncbi:MAG: hypothetical protein ABIA78_02455 [archaeon]